MKSKSQKKDWNEKDTHGWLPINCRHKAGNLRTRGFPKCPTFKKSTKQADGLVLVASPEVSYDVYYRVPLCFNLAKFGETWSDVRSETVPPRNVVSWQVGHKGRRTRRSDPRHNVGFHCQRRTWHWKHNGGHWVSRNASCWSHACPCLSVLSMSLQLDLLMGCSWSMGHWQDGVSFVTILLELGLGRRQKLQVRPVSKVVKLETFGYPEPTHPFKCINTCPERTKTQNIKSEKKARLRSGWTSTLGPGATANSQVSQMCKSLTVRSCKKMIKNHEKLIWLVVEPYPSEKWWNSSVGMMTFPIIWKNHPNVPNHQPVMNSLRNVVSWCNVWHFKTWPSMAQPVS